MLTVRPVFAAAQEGRYLDDVDYLSCRPGLPGFVDVGENAQAVPALDVCEHLQSLLQARSAERAEGCTVGFVEGGFEDDFCARLLMQADEFRRYRVEQFAALYHTRPGDEYGIRCFGHYRFVNIRKGIKNSAIV